MNIEFAMEDTLGPIGANLCLLYLSSFQTHFISIRHKVFNPDKTQLCNGHPSNLGLKDIRFDSLIIENQMVKPRLKKWLHIK